MEAERRQNGRKMDAKWMQDEGKMEAKWRQDGGRMEAKWMENRAKDPEKSPKARPRNRSIACGKPKMAGNVL